MSVTTFPLHPYHRCFRRFNTGHTPVHIIT